MSPSPQLTWKQLKEIIEDEMKTDQGSRAVQEQVEDGEVVLNPDNTSSVLSTVLNTITNEFEHECLDEAVTLLNAHPIRQSTMTVCQATTIQFQACRELSSWRTRCGPSGAS